MWKKKQENIFERIQRIEDEVTGLTATISALQMARTKKETELAKLSVNAAKDGWPDSVYGEA